jgi:hypothetical protein
MKFDKVDSMSATGTFPLAIPVTTGPTASVVGTSKNTPFPEKNYLFLPVQFKQVY